MSDSSTATAAATPRPQRPDLAPLLDDFRKRQQHDPISLRRFAKRHGVPRSTLRYRLKRHQSIDLDDPTKDFLASPHGRRFLARLLVALHFCFPLQGGCGLRLLAQFLRLTRLDRLVASSFGACQKRQDLLEKAVCDFTKEQRLDLAKDMTAKDILAALDETFHPDCLLVALDPDSGFLLCEQYAKGRSEQDWRAALQAGLEGLEVKIVACTGDQAKGLVACATNSLGVPHGPDLFHVEHNLSKPLTLPLAGQTKAALQSLEEVRQDLQAAQEGRLQAVAQPRGPGRPVDHDRRVQEAALAVQSREEEWLACVGRQERLKEALLGLSDAYHPVDLQSGAAQSAEAVRGALGGRLLEVAEVAAEAGREQAGQEAVSKARGLVPALVAMVALFWARVKASAGARLGEGNWGWAEGLCCGCYLERAAGRSRTADQRDELLALAEGVVERAREASGLGEERWREALAWGRGVAGWFSRGSSAVEGRNRHLRLARAGLHRLSERKLRALTAVHNYWLKRADGSTAAGRFFGREPADLFAYLVDRLPPPASPAKQRKRAA